jgi:protoheme IX farnesyltransferase
MLPVIDSDGVETGRQILLYSLALLPASILPSLLGLTNANYGIGALVLSLALLGFSIAAAWSKSRASSRRLLQATVFYLPLLFGLMMFTRR